MFDFLAPDSKEENYEMNAEYDHDSYESDDECSDSNSKRDEDVELEEIESGEEFEYAPVSEKITTTLIKDSLRSYLYIRI